MTNLRFLVFFFMTKFLLLDWLELCFSNCNFRSVSVYQDCQVDCDVLVVPVVLRTVRVHLCSAADKKLWCKFNETIILRLNTLGQIQWKIIILRLKTLRHIQWKRIILCLRTLRLIQWKRINLCLPSDFKKI